MGIENHERYARFGYSARPWCRRLWASSPPAVSQPSPLLGAFTRRRPHLDPDQEHLRDASNDVVVSPIGVAVRTPLAFTYTVPVAVRSNSVTTITLAITLTPTLTIAPPRRTVKKILARLW